MKKAKLLALILIGTFLFVGTNTSNAAESAIEEYYPVWNIDENWTQIYRITTLNYNTTGANTNSFMMYDSNEEYIGNVTEGDLFFARNNHLPDLAVESNLTEYDLWASGATDGWQLEYESPLAVNHSQNNLDYLYFGIPVWEYANNWTDIATEFQTDFTVVNNDTHFEITGFNVGNVYEIQAAWSKSTGILEYYWIETANGPDGEDLTMELNFMYCRDESQWGVGFNIYSGDTAGWNQTIVSYNNTNTFKPGDTITFVEGEPLIVRFDEVPDFDMMQNTEPHWNGTMYAGNTSEHMEFRFDSGDDGPSFFFPVLMSGNDDFYANITDDMEAKGAIVTKDEYTFNITVISSEINESAVWDLSTGLLETYTLEFIQDNETLFLQLDFAYYLPASDLDWFVMDDWARYEFYGKNGTELCINMGDDENPQLFCQGDLLDYKYSHHEDNHAVGSLNHYGSEGTDSDDDMWFEYYPIGIEMYSEGGPPGAYFIIPTPMSDAQTWWTNVGDAYESLGYQTIETTNSIGFSATKNDYNVTTYWDKTTGVVKYYHLNTTLENGDVLVFQIELAYYYGEQYFDMHWGVNEGDLFAFEAINIDIDGNNYMVLDHEKNLNFTEGDLMVMQLRNLSYIGPVFNETPIWNASIMLKDGNSEICFNMGEKIDPYLNIPLMPVGNEAWVGNVTDQMNAVGHIASSYSDTDGDYLNITYVNGSTTYIAIWNINTGIMSYYKVASNEFNLEFKFVYYLPDPPTAIGVDENYYVRYIVNVQNGTRDYIGEKDGEDDFIIYDDSMMGISYHNLSSSFDNMGEAYVHMYTNYGQEEDMYLWLAPPGLQLYFEDGPPIMWLIQTGGDSAWWNAVEKAYMNLGYLVYNTPTQFKFSFEDENLNFTTAWDKATGMIDYFYIEMFGGETLFMELTRGTTLTDMTALTYTWGVDAGVVYDFEFLDINVDSSNQLEFEGGSFMGIGDTITTEINYLSPTMEDGLYTNVTYYFGGHSSLQQVYFEEPGFEFAKMGEKMEHGYTPFFYPVIPLGTDWINLVIAMWEETPGYTVISNGTHLQLDGYGDTNNYFTIVWNATSGVLLYYLMNIMVGNDGGGTLPYKLEILLEGIGTIPVITSTTTGTTTTTTSDNSTTTSDGGGTVSTAPGFEISIVFTLVLGLIVIRRRKY